MNKQVRYIYDNIYNNPGGSIELETLLEKSYILDYLKNEDELYVIHPNEVEDQVEEEESFL